MNRSLKKTLEFLFTSFFAMTLIFFALRLTPGDPVVRILGPEATFEELEKLREQLGLHLSFIEQYWMYIKNLFKGDLGSSLFKKESIVELMKIYMPPSLILGFFSVLLSSIIGTYLGVLSAIKKKMAFDKNLRVLSLLGLSFPIFSLAPLLVYLFSIKLQILPVSEWGSVKHAILPILTLVIPLSTIITRVTRNRFLEEKEEMWVQVLRAKGLTDVNVYKHVTRSILPTILNVVAIQLSVVLAGTIITETIFDIPGMGLLLFEGIQNRDYPLVQGIIMYVTVIYLGVYYFVDFVNAKMDPRITE